MHLFDKFEKLQFIQSFFLRSLYLRHTSRWKLCHQLKSWKKGGKKVGVRLVFFIHSGAIWMFCIFRFSLVLIARLLCLFFHFRSYCNSLSKCENNGQLMSRNNFRFQAMNRKTNKQTLFFSNGRWCLFWYLVGFIMNWNGILKLIDQQDCFFSLSIITTNTEKYR